MRTNCAKCRILPLISCRLNRQTQPIPGLVRSLSVVRALEPSETACAAGYLLHGGLCPFEHEGFCSKFACCQLEQGVCKPAEALILHHAVWHSPWHGQCMSNTGQRPRLVFNVAANPTVCNWNHSFVKARAFKCCANKQGSILARHTLSTRLVRLASQPCPLHSAEQSAFLYLDFNLNQHV